MQELAQKNKSQVLKNKKSYSKKNTQIQKLSLILPQLSTLNEKGLNPYWNQQCQEMQLKLWLPHKTDLQGQDSDLSSGSSNYTVEKSSHWKKRLVPKHLTPKSLLVSLPASATPTMEKGQ